MPLTPHGKKQARGTVKREHSEDEPDDVPEKHSSSSAKASAKAARSTMLEVKQEPQTMAEKKKRKAEERSPPKVPLKKSEAEMPKKKKDKDKPARGNVSFAIGGKGPQKSISAAPTRAEKFQHEGGYDRDLETMQRISETDFNATVGRLVMHYKECLSEEPKSKQELGLALLLHTSVRALSVQSVLRCGTKNAQWNPSGIRPGMCCALCACYALHVSRFWPSSGGQHPVFRVLQAPVRVKEEPPDSPERHAEPEGDPDTEMAAEGKLTDGEIQEV